MKVLVKIQNLSLPVKASIAFLIINIIQKGLSFLTTPIFTRLLDTSEYGEVATFYSILEVVGIFAMFCLQGGIFNNGMVDYPEKRSEFSFSMLSLSNLITLIILLPILIFRDFFMSLTGMGNYMIILMFVYFFIQPGFGFWASRQRYEYKYKSLCWVSILLSLLAPSVAILFIIYNPFNNRVADRLIGFECPLIFCYIILYIKIAKDAKFKIDITYWKSALAFNIVLIPHYLSTYILSSSDRIMIAKLDSPSAAGIYSLGYSIGLVLMSLWIAINNSLIPYTYERCKNNDYTSISNTTIKIIYFFALCCFCLIIISPEFIFFLAPQSYHDALHTIPAIVGGIFFLALYNIFATIVYYHKKPKFIMIGSIVSAFLNIILNLWAIPIWGYMAAAYTTLFCYMVQVCIDYAAMVYVIKRDIYSFKRIGFLSLLILIISIAGSYLYPYVLLRYFIVLIVFVFLILKRNKILHSFK